MKKRWLCGLLCLCLLLCSIPITAFAEEALTGTVHLTSGYLKIRAEAPSGKEIGQLYDGDKVTVLDTQVIDGKKWHKVSKGSVVGWSSAEFIEIHYTYENDQDFEAYLSAQKFPEDYKVKLREIHAQYPQWIFKAQHLSMTWNAALTAESEALKNAIQSPDSWKSMEYGAYNWKTGSYVAADSGGWVTASPRLVAHYMDPRNFLDATYILQFEDLKYSDTHTVEGVKAILSSHYDQYAADLLKAAKEAQVSAYHLATRMTQEGSKVDGTFTGDDGVNYDGYYNFFNIGAYAGSQHGAYHGANTNGAIYAKKNGWNTPYNCLLGSAQELGKKYINRGQNTLYYQKFNVAGENLYNHQYMSNVQAPWAESRIRANALTEAEQNGAMVFVIPVYKEMPATVAPLPGKTGNNNNFLDSITVDACKLSPTFDRYTMEYTGAVGESVTSIKVVATKNAGGATVSGAGTIQLRKGENVIPITVTATSGEVRTYTIIITAPGGSDQPTQPTTPTTPTNPINPSNPTTKPTTKPTVPTPSIQPATYTVTDTITGVKPETTVDAFIKALGVKNGSVALYDADGKAKTTGAVATGDILRLYDTEKSLRKSYPVIILGDVNGDGKVNSQDLRRTQRHILGTAALSGYYLTAADANKDSKVNSQDLRRTQRFILGILETL